MIPSISVHSLLDLDAQGTVVSSGKDVIVFEHRGATVIVVDVIKMIYRLDPSGHNYSYSYELMDYQGALELLESIIRSAKAVADKAL